MSLPPHCTAIQIDRRACHPCPACFSKLFLHRSLGELGQRLATLSPLLLALKQRQFEVATQQVFGGAAALALGAELAAKLHMPPGTAGQFFAGMWLVLGAGTRALAFDNDKHSMLTNEVAAVQRISQLALRSEGLRRCAADCLDPKQFAGWLSAVVAAMERLAASPAGKQGGENLCPGAGWHLIQHLHRRPPLSPYSAEVYSALLLPAAVPLMMFHGGADMFEQQTRLLKQDRGYAAGCLGC